MTLHLNNCRAQFQPFSTVIGRKRISNPTIAQRADHILQLMKRPHTSGNQCNLNRLSYPPLVPTVSNISSTVECDQSLEPSGVDSHTDLDFRGDDCHIDNELHEPNTGSNDRELFKHNINPPPGVKFCIHLQNILSSHRGIDLNLYDEIIDLIKYHATKRETNFSTNKLYHRDELTATLSSLYNLHDLRPNLHNVTISDGSVVTVPIFNVKAVILSILQDPKRMQQQHFAPGYDIFSGKPTEPNTAYLHEIHTGALWKPARDFYCGDNDAVFPLGLMCFYDKTHTDLYGALSCAPFIMTFSFFNESARSNDSFYGVLGYIPNLTYGQGKSNNKDPRQKLQDEHNCLKLITDQIRELANGFATTVLGRRVIVKPWIHCITGDTSGHNNIIGQYNSSNAKYPYRDCKCSLDQLSNPSPQCQLVTMANYNIAKSEKCLHEFSLHDINNAFSKLPFADIVHGMFGCVPAEMLHVSGNGIMQYQLDIIYSIIGAGTNKQNTLHLLDILHQNLVQDAALQSERDMPRMSDRNGVTDGTKMSASERVGNMFILLCAMHTKHGEQLFVDGCNASGISLQNLRDCITLQLGFEKWVNDTNTVQDVENAAPVLADLIRSIQTFFPRNTGNGWCIPKIHSLAKMLHYMKQFGKAKNFSGQVGERVLKSIVKDHSQQTQRRVNVFASQCAKREFESFVQKYAYNDVADSFDANYHCEDNRSPDVIRCSGKHTILFAECDNRGRGDIKVTWADMKRNEINQTTHEIVTYALRSFAIANDWLKPFEVHGFTSACLPVNDDDNHALFYANPYVYGRERYHFAMVTFKDDNKCRTHVQHVYSHLLGF
jgi:hypothetical protein